MRAMLTNPEMMRNMMTPENMQAAMGMMGQGGAGGMPGMGGMGGMPGMGGMGGMLGMGGGMPAMDPAMMAQMQAMMGGGAGGAGAQADDKPPKEKYAAEIAQIKEMGFNDEEVICQALVQANGNVNLALEKLFSSMN
jgi:hypothetical protein